MASFQVGEILYRKAPCHFQTWPIFIRVMEVITFPPAPPPSPAPLGVKVKGVAMKPSKFVSFDSTKVHVVLDEARQANQDQLVHKVFGLTLPILHIETIKTYYRKFQRPSPKAEDEYVVNMDVIPVREINILQTTTIKEGFDLLPYFPTDLVYEIIKFCLEN